MPESSVARLILVRAVGRRAVCSARTTIGCPPTAERNRHVNGEAKLPTIRSILRPLKGLSTQLPDADTLNNVHLNRMIALRMLDENYPAPTAAFPDSVAPPLIRKYRDPVPSSQRID